MRRQVPLVSTALLIALTFALDAGAQRKAASPADIAPTLARILRVQAPSSTVGRVLLEALR